MSVRFRKESSRDLRNALVLGLTLLLAESSTAGRIIGLRHLSGQAAASDWVKFDTDACGELGRVEDHHSMVGKEATGDEADDDSGDRDEDYSWTKIWGIPDADSSAAETWLSAHPDVAIVTDSVERSCDDRTDDLEPSDTADIA